MKMKSILSDLLPQRKQKEAPKEEIPVAKYTSNDLVLMKDGTYQIVFQILESVNTELLSEQQLMKVAQATQKVVNLTLKSAKILISSERLEIEKYENYLQGKADNVRDSFSLERIHEMRDYIVKRANNDNTDHKFYVAFSSQFKKEHEANQELADVKKYMKEILKSQKIHFKQLKGDEVRRVVYEKLNPHISDIRPYETEMTDREISPTYIFDKDKYLEMDEFYYTFYTFNEYKTDVDYSWLKSIIDVSANLDLSITLTPLSKVDFKDEVSKTIKATREKMEEKKLPESQKMDYQDEIDSQMQLLKDLRKEDDLLFNTVIIMCIRENDFDRLKFSEKRFEIAASGFSVRKLAHTGKFLMWYNLPTIFHDAKLEKKIGWPILSSAIGGIIPFDSSNLQYNEGIVKGMNAGNNSLIIYNRYNKSRILNPNQTIIGSSGTGKSYGLRADIYRESTMGDANRIFTIDPEREYFFPNDQRITFKIGSEFVTNPFHIRSTIIDSDNDREDGRDDVGQYLRLKISEMLSFFHWIYPDMNEGERSNLLTALKICYAECGLNFESQRLVKEFPTLTMLDQVLRAHYSDNMRPMIDRLQPFCGRKRSDEGIYASMFDGQTNWDLQHKNTVLDIHELGEAIKKPMMDLLTKFVWEESKLDRQEAKLLNIDEMHLLADDKFEQAMVFLYQIYKRIRKYRGAVTGATQGISEFLEIGKYGNAILDNSFIKTFYPMGEVDFSIVQKYFSFSEKEIEVLLDRNTQGQGIHIVGSKRVKLQTFMTLAEMKVLDPEQAQKLIV